MTNTFVDAFGDGVAAPRFEQVENFRAVARDAAVCSPILPERCISWV
jgi:hypothetical protein